MLDKHRLEVRNPQRKGKVGNQWVKDYLTEYAESFPQVSSLLEANIHRCIYGQKGFEHYTFEEMWELYSQYLTQKDRPEHFSAEQRELTHKAYTSVRRWLHTPVTHITSVQMKRFRKYLKEKEQASTRCDPSSSADDDAELVAASQEVEDLLKFQEPPCRKTGRQSQDFRPTDRTKPRSQSETANLPTTPVRPRQPETPPAHRDPVHIQGS
ncbi:uncharacterized protein LOC134109761 [Pungitius pungitius]|uniref:uncharacterized protein LOC134104106 n=1 Tax=Pungitius pungitius TaxID=134920 RepID=UPI002E132821